jgi:hypothetical protein
MKKPSKNCQSCGMPLKRDDQGGGTNADGSKNEMYCSHCFQACRFVLPDLTVEQMQQRVREKITEFGLPGFVAGLLVRGIPKLERWQPQAPATPAQRA